MTTVAPLPETGTQSLAPTPAALVPVAPVCSPVTRIDSTVTERTTCRVPALDGLRGLAILLVLLFHWTVIGVAGAKPDRALQKIASTGWIGVELFFVLSGFLITGLLLDARTKPNYFRNFYARRALRILPLNLVFLLAIFALLPLLPASHFGVFGTLPPRAWPYWMFGGNFANLFYPPGNCEPLGALWSLAIEEQFYLVWPLCVLVLSPRLLQRFCVLLLLAAPMTRAILVARGASYLQLYNITPLHMDPLVLGSLLAVLHHRGVLHRFTRIATALAIAIPVMLVALDVIGGKLEADPVFQVFGFSLLAVLFGSLLLCALHRRSIARVFENPALCWFGGISYALYLFNLPVKLAIQHFAFDPLQALHVHGSALGAVGAFYLACGAVALPMAWASWHLLEQPALRLKRFFPMPRTLPAGPADVPAPAFSPA